MSRSAARAAVIGSSGGIGRALAASLAARGAEVHALSRAGTEDDPRLEASHIDVEDEATIVRAALAVATHGPLDLIIVATGMLHDRQTAPEKSYRHLSRSTLDRYFAINATGPALVAKHFLPLLRPQARSVFAALSARVGSIGDNRLGGWYGYRASKAALNMLVRTLSIELARARPDTICVALHPGTVETPLSRPFAGRVAAGSLFTPTASADRLLSVLADLRPTDTGGHFAWDGSRIPS